jgi:hypothetical protein
VARWFTLVAAVLSTAIFILVRNTLDLEESRFVIALLVCSMFAATLALVSTAALHGATRSSVRLGFAAFVLVPVLYATYLVLFVATVCVIGGETCYS